MKTILVSGGIGSGKSVFCAMLEKRGVPVYDCDSRAKELYTSYPGLLSEVEEALGESFRTPDGQLDRGALAKRIFSSATDRDTLESILYPLLLDDFKAWRSSRKEKAVALESAVILSKPVFDGVADYVIWLEAPEGKRVERVISRDGSSRQEVLSRMEAQLSCAEKADIVIHNDGSLSDLSRKMDEVFEKLTV